MSKNQLLVIARENDNSAKRYYLVNREKRQILRRLVKDGTPCHHRQVYTQANFVCKRIAILYESGKIPAEQAGRLMLETHDLMSHRGMSKQGACRLVNEKLDRLLDTNCRQ